jgi:hypothetical protein
MNNFNPDQHPRVDDGTFAQKFQSAPETPELKAATDHIQKISDEAGLGGIGPEIISIIQDREEVTAEQIAALTADDITSMYEHVAKGIDGAERHLLDLATLREDEPADESKTADHLRAVTAEAWSESMNEVLTVIRDRGEVSDASLQAIDVGDVVDMYDTYIAPAVDKAERHILDKGALTT